jgi:CO/xanthine dehydrogenase Mo-binding subunit
VFHYPLLILREMPELDLDHRETPAPLKPLGVKAIGEADVLPISVTVVSAVDDALSPFDIRLRQFPMRPRGSRGHTGNGGGGGTRILIARPGASGPWPFSA